MRQLFEIADFLRTARRRLRFGELSRAPLQILRLELRGDAAECEWVTRAPDELEAELPAAMRARRASFQALVDAMAIRAVIFDQLGCVRRALVRAFRPSVGGAPEVIITGTIDREDAEPFRVSSLAMRARLCGFRFEIEDGALKPLQSGTGAATD